MFYHLLAVRHIKLSSSGDWAATKLLPSWLSAILQEFVLVKTLQEASGLIRSVAWSQHLLAAGGDDKIVRIYDALQDLSRRIAGCEVKISFAVL